MRRWILTDCLLLLSLSLAGGCALMRHASASEPSGDRLMKVTLVPTVREIFVLERVNHDAPLEGITLRNDAAQTLRVVATGTGGLSGAAWLEGRSGPVGRAELAWNPETGQYVGEMVLSTPQVSADHYDVKAVLLSEGKQVTEIITAFDPVDIGIEIGGATPELARQDDFEKLLWEVQDYYAYFETSADQLAEADRLQAQERIVQALLPHKDRIQSIRVEGHCDPRGADEYNHELGAKRAQSLAALLAERLSGVPIVTVSLGEAQLDVEDPGPEAMHLQRWARVRLLTNPR